MTEDDHVVVVLDASATFTRTVWRSSSYERGETEWGAEVGVAHGEVELIDSEMTCGDAACVTLYRGSDLANRLNVDDRTRFIDQGAHCDINMYDRGDPICADHTTGQAQVCETWAWTTPAANRAPSVAPFVIG